MPLRDRLSSSDPLEVIRAADAIAVTADPVPDATIDALTAELRAPRNNNVYVAAALIRALGRIGAKARSAIPLITPYALGGDGTISYDARAALDAIDPIDPPRLPKGPRP